MTKRAQPLRHDCGDHPPVVRPRKVTAEAFERAAALFRAAGDPSRLRLLHLLDAGERCVTDLADVAGTKLSTLSQQLRVLHGERFVKRRREGKHVYYSLADAHVRDLVWAALDHAGEPRISTTRKKEP